MTLNTITHRAKHRDDVTLLEAPCWHSRHKRDVGVEEWIADGGYLAIAPGLHRGPRSVRWGFELRAVDPSSYGGYARSVATARTRKRLLAWAIAAGYGPRLRNANATKGA